jgi:hypothetical protein
MPVMPQKAAGWRIEPPVSVPVAAGARRAAIAAAEPPEEPPGTASASREFVAIQLAQRDHAGIAEFFDDGRIEGADIVAQHLGGGGRAPAPGDEDVLVRDRDPGQQAGAALGQARIGSRGLGQRQFRIHVQEGVVLAGRDAVQIMPGQLGGGHLFGMQERGQLLDGFIMHDNLRRSLADIYSITFGTKYKPSCAFGAGAW